MITLAHQIEIAGITLEMKACISAEALQGAGGDLAPADRCGGTQDATWTVDLAQLQGVMQPLLVTALHGLQENLAVQACQSLLDEIESKPN